MSWQSQKVYKYTKTQAERGRERERAYNGDPYATHIFHKPNNDDIEVVYNGHTFHNIEEVGLIFLDHSTSFSFYLFNYIYKGNTEI